MSLTRPKITKEFWKPVETSDARSKGYIRVDKSPPGVPAICKVMQQADAEETQANMKAIASLPILLNALECILSVNTTDRPPASSFEAIRGLANLALTCAGYKFEPKS